MNETTTRRKRKKRQIYTWNSLRFLRRHLMVLFSIGLLGLSYYYYAQVQEFRRSINRTDVDAFASGDVVTIKTIKDGDEIVVTAGKDKQALVRILGIQSFDPAVNDPVVSRIGNACFSYLKNNYEDRKASLILGRTKQDSEGRLLAYLAVQEKPGASFSFDLGEDLLRRGLTQVYVRYPFEREDYYTRIEAEAESKGEGIWGSPGATDRANAFRRQWRQARREAGQ